LVSGRNADIPVIFRAPPVRAGDFLLLCQEQVTKEKATPLMRPPHIHVLRMHSQSPGSADGTFMCPRRTAPHPAGHPSDFPPPARRIRGAHLACIVRARRDAMTTHKPAGVGQVITRHGRC